MQHAHIDRAIDYIEFTAPDLNDIKNFYGKAFDWKFQDWGDDYVSFNDGRVDGGFARGTGKTGSGPLVILYSSVLESVQQKVKDAGAGLQKTHSLFQEDAVFTSLTLPEMNWLYGQTNSRKPARFNRISQRPI